MKPNHRAILKSHKLSLTAVRLAVLEALWLCPHAEAEQIFQQVKSTIATTSLQAIYNNLNTLVKHGIVREIKPKGRPSMFETRVGDNHHHLVCRQCKLIIDTDCLGAAPCLIPKNDQGFVIDEAEVILWGTCPACQKHQNRRGV